jgi:PKD repeat protein
MKNFAISVLIMCLIAFTILPIGILTLTPTVNAQTQTIVSLTPSSYNATQLNETFTVDIAISNVQNLWSWHACIVWDPTYLNLTGKPSEGDFITDITSTLFVYTPPGVVAPAQISDTAMSLTDEISGSGTLATLCFQIIRPFTQTHVALTNITLLGLGDPDAPVGEPKPEISIASDYCSTAVFLVNEGPPIADAGTDQTVPKGTSVLLNASHSLASGDTATYVWTFTDGTQKTIDGKIVNYTFQNPGVYTVTLTVQDSIGSSNCTIIITVEDVIPPTPIINITGFTGGQSVSSGQQLTFDGSGSFDSHNQPVDSYRWDFGDNSAIQTSPIVNHAFYVLGTHIVTLTVSDAEGNKANTTSTLLVVQGATQTPHPTTTLNNYPSSSQPQIEDSFKLPPTILCIVVAVTVLVVSGSALWLRRTT